MGNASSSYTDGFHVLKVQPNSPGFKAGLTTFFDFIVEADNTLLDKGDNTFIEILKKHVDQPLKLVVYNSKTDTTRETTVIPTRSWGGEGLLGASIRHSSLKGVNERVWHVLDVYPNSPAAAAGLESFVDYVVGAPDIIFSDNEDFFTFVNSRLGKQIQLYIYSTKTDDIRIINITPNKNWGGNGSLGCDIGYGYLHRIPITASAQKQAQGTQPPLQQSTPPNTVPSVGSTISPSTIPSIPTTTPPITTIPPNTVENPQVTAIPSNPPLTNVVAASSTPITVAPVSIPISTSATQVSTTTTTTPPTTATTTVNPPIATSASFPMVATTAAKATVPSAPITPITTTTTTTSVPPTVTPTPTTTVPATATPTATAAPALPFKLPHSAEAIQKQLAELRAQQQKLQEALVSTKMQ